MTLRQYRAAHGLTLSGLAALLGRPLSTVHGWETGRRVPSLSDAMTIQAALDGAVTVAELLPEAAPA